LKYVETVWQRYGEYQAATRPPGIRPCPTGPRFGAEVPGGRFMSETDQSDQTKPE